MTYFLFIVKSALEDFKKNKLRTFLTSLGILIGVSSVVILISFGLGLKKYIENQFKSMGSNLVMVLPGNIIQGGNFQGGSTIGGIKFDEKDVRNIKKVKNASIVVPFFVKMLKIQADGKSDRFKLYASTADLFPGLVEVEFGEPFKKADVDKSSKKVVLGSKVSEKLFGTAENALYKTVKIENQAFKVVGVAKSRGGGSLGAPSVDDHVYVPYKSAYSFNPDKKFFALSIKSDNSTNLNELKQNIEKILLKRYKKDDFSVIEQKELLNAINSIFGILNTVVVSIAAISLIVGGVGIMNIMYVTVVEKTKEIGIRRAIGATQNDILMQFLAESVILSLLGGFLGLAISYIIIFFVQRIFPAYINLQSVLIALGVSSLIGVVFGVLPAKKASDLSPIDAIRYE